MKELSISGTVYNYNKNVDNRYKNVRKGLHLTETEVEMKKRKERSVIQRGCASDQSEKKKAVIHLQMLEIPKNVRIGTSLFY